MNVICHMFEMANELSQGQISPIKSCLNEL